MLNEKEISKDIQGKIEKMASKIDYYLNSYYVDAKVDEFEKHRRFGIAAKEINNISDLIKQLINNLSRMHDDSIDEDYLHFLGKLDYELSNYFAIVSKNVDLAINTNSTEKMRYWTRAYDNLHKTIEQIEWLNKICTKKYNKLFKTWIVEVNRNKDNSSRLIIKQNQHDEERTITTIVLNKRNMGTFEDGANAIIKQLREQKPNQILFDNMGISIGLCDEFSKIIEYQKDVKLNKYDSTLTYGN